jgi:hypothetical protein
MNIIMLGCQSTNQHGNQKGMVPCALVLMIQHKKQPGAIWRQTELNGFHVEAYEFGMKKITHQFHCKWDAALIA